MHIVWDSLRIRVLKGVPLEAAWMNGLQVPHRERRINIGLQDRVVISRPVPTAFTPLT